MKPRPYVLLSAAASLDGYLDDAGDTRLLLSNDADFDRVDEVRAGVDAILVGANTVRRDDPRLLVRSATRMRGRSEAGLPASPAKVTLTGSGKLDPAARFFTAGEAERLVYVASPALRATRERLGSLATVVDGGEPLDLPGMLEDLRRRGVRRLMVEGGAAVQASLLAAGVVDELQLVYAPLFLGSAGGARFAGSGELGQGGHDPMTLAEVRQIGEHVLLRYLLGETAHGGPTPEDRRHLRAAIELSRNCPISASAFSVGAVVVAADGTVLATGYSRESDPTVHAEEAALAKLAPAEPALAGATVYSSLEPCSSRASRPLSCTRLILDTGIARVVFAWREPALFVDCEGTELLREAGREVVEVDDLAPLVREVNAHLPGIEP